MKKFAVFISGEGENLQALINACHNHQIHAEIACVVSNCVNAYGLQRAKQAGIATEVFSRKDFESKVLLEQALIQYLQQKQVDFIVLAGFMQILSTQFIQHFPGKILNVHPSLLPKYAGLDTYARAISAKETEHGMSIHFVNEQVDGGAIILQAKVPIFPEDGIEEVQQRVKEQEIHFYPLVVQWLVTKRLVLKDNQAYLDGQLLPAQGYANT